MREWRHDHWKLFNAGARVLGVASILIGIILCVSGIGMRSNENGSADAWTMIVVSLIVVVFGVLLLFARPYKPNGSEKGENNEGIE